MFPKRLLALTLFAALAVMPTCVLRAQWQPTNGPYGASIRALAVSGTNLFAGGSGLFRSTDDGTSWTAENTGLMGYVFSLAVSGTNLFAGTGNGVFLSTNNGTSWTPSSSGLPPLNPYVPALVVSGTNLFAGFGNFGGTGEIFRSTDSGTSWTAASNGFYSIYITSFAVSGT